MAKRPIRMPLPDHPDLDLKAIELDLMGRVLTAKHKRKLWNPSAIEDAEHTEVVQPLQPECCSGLPEWVPVEEPPAQSEMQNSGRRHQIDKDDPVVRHHVVPIADEEIERNRLDSGEIRKLLKCDDHEFGEPSTVLFVKNLAKGVCETDLIAIFGRYDMGDRQKLEYRLMTGKMRGQAFIKFADADCATKALKFIHGFVWKGKPIVIQYGRQRQNH